MYTINLALCQGVKFSLFPDNQPHANIGHMPTHEMIRVIAPMRSSQEAVRLFQVFNALENQGIWSKDVDLYIPYLMGARSDREFQEGDSVDIEVTAKMINSLGCNFVEILDPHNPNLVKRLINRSSIISNDFLVVDYLNRTPGEDIVLIAPDQGARAHATYRMGLGQKFTDLIYCEKRRDTQGKVSLNVVQPELADGRNCAIVDDLCDGGATFKAIASQINPKSLDLVVTHGIFSKGLRTLLDAGISNIYTTNSYNWQIHSQLFMKDVLQ